MTPSPQTQGCNQNEKTTNRRALHTGWQLSGTAIELECMTGAGYGGGYRRLLHAGGGVCHEGSRREAPPPTRTAINDLEDTDMI